MKIIVCGLKILGKEHIQKAIDGIHLGLKSGSKMIVAFDMVNEEDTTPPIRDFVQQIQ